MTCISRHTKENPISKVSVNLNLAMPSYASLCAVHFPIGHSVIFSLGSEKNSIIMLFLALQNCLCNSALTILVFCGLGNNSDQKTKNLNCSPNPPCRIYECPFKSSASYLPSLKSVSSVPSTCKSFFQSGFILLAYERMHAEIAGHF